MTVQNFVAKACQSLRCSPRLKLCYPLQALQGTENHHLLGKNCSALHLKSFRRMLYTTSMPNVDSKSLKRNTTVFNTYSHTNSSSVWYTGINVRSIRDFHSSSNQNSDSKALTIWSDVKELKSSPMPALLFGLSGLIPFVALPAYMISQQLYVPEAVFAQVAYGACILSFLGGVRWGLTLPQEGAVRPDWINLGYSVSPSLVAWTGLLLPGGLSLLTIMGGLGLTCYMDLVMYGYPPWFKGLRFVLSLVSILALWTSFMCSFIMKEKNALGDGGKVTENVKEA